MFNRRQLLKGSLLIAAIPLSKYLIQDKPSTYKTVHQVKTSPFITVTIKKGVWQDILKALQKEGYELYSCKTNKFIGLSIENNYVFLYEYQIGISPKKWPFYIIYKGKKSIRIGDTITLNMSNFLNRISNRRG